MKLPTRFALPFASLFALMLVSCTTAQRAPQLDDAQLVDLTYAFNERTLYWPNDPGTFRLEQRSHGHTEGGYFYSANTFSAPEHGGTHIDAPIHFAEGKRTVDQIPPRQLLAPAVVIDVAAQSNNDPDYRLTVADVEAWEAKHGRIGAGTIVLLRTGWGSRYGDRKRYFGDDTPGATENLHFPSFGPEAAQLLVEQRRVGAIGVDTPSIDYGQSRDFMVHRISSRNDVPGLENVANLHLLPERGAWVIALPMKIENGSGAPLRIVAVLPR
ncbi:MAG TPA: cyclase family protein [Thermoanaerobaculia bacterium]